MKLIAKTLLLTILLLPIAITAQVSAQETQTPVSQTQEADRQAKAEALKQRLQQRKDAAKLRLQAAEKSLIQLRCKASQAHLGRVSSRVTGLSASRKKVYDNLPTRLSSLSQKIQTNGLDTAQLDQQTAELQLKIDDFYTSLDKYSQAVGDLAGMDCAADPEAYKASLEEARKLRIETVQAAEAIHGYLKDTIKPTLQTLRAQLANQHT